MSGAARLAAPAALALALAATSAAAQPSGAAATYTLSGEASFAGAAAWAEDEDPRASDALYGSDAALELALDAKRPGVRASFSARADALSGAAAAAAIADSAAPAARQGRLVAATPSGDAALSLSIERAYLRWSPGPLVATLGRQVINWGGALLWSPADLFAETRLTGLAPERAGTDAARLALPLGALGGLEAVAAPAMDFTEGRYGGRAYGYALGADFGLQAAWDGRDGATTLAANVKADLVLGLWLEASYTLYDDGARKDRLEAVAGADWSLGSRLVASAEYRYCPQGAKDAAEALAASLAGEPYPAVHYLYASASAKAGDFAAIGFGLVADLGNAIIAGTLSLALDVAQDASLALWGGYGSGSFATLGSLDSASAGLSLSLAF